MSNFYTKKILQTKFYTKKNAQIGTSLALKLHKIETKNYFWGTNLGKLEEEENTSSKDCQLSDFTDLAIW